MDSYGKILYFCPNCIADSYSSSNIRLFKNDFPDNSLQKVGGKFHIGLDIKMFTYPQKVVAYRSYLVNLKHQTWPVYSYEHLRKTVTL